MHRGSLWRLIHASAVPVLRMVGDVVGRGITMAHVQQRQRFMAAYLIF